jgi:hypothetical protein
MLKTWKKIIANLKSKEMHTKRKVYFSVMKLMQASFLFLYINIFICIFIDVKIVQN